MVKVSRMKEGKRLEKKTQDTEELKSKDTICPPKEFLKRF
jgi:hypothetical protein